MTQEVESSAPGQGVDGVGKLHSLDRVDVLGAATEKKVREDLVGGEGRIGTELNFGGQHRAKKVHTGRDLLALRFRKHIQNRRRRT